MYSKKKTIDKCFLNPGHTVNILCFKHLDIFYLFYFFGFVCELTTFLVWQRMMIAVANHVS